MSKPDKKTVRETQTINVFFEHNQFLPLLYGERDAHLKRLETALGIELVARGNMPYSAVTQPLPVFRKNGGTEVSTDAVHNTFVWPNSTRHEPSAWRET